MADRNPTQQQRTPQRPIPATTTTASAATAMSSFLQKLQAHAPTSTQLMGFLTLVITAAILLFLTGVTITASVFGLIFFAPLIIISSPIWVPIGAVLFLAVAGFLSLCGFGVTAVAGLSWLYKYFKGLHPPGSDRVDYARTRISNTASHVKDYAREFGNLQSRVKDAAPGA